MKILSERIAFLVSHRESLEKWVGTYDEASLRKWLDAELGDSRRLEAWIAGSKVIPRTPILHIVSGNTPHAAFQSVFRALLLGCESWVKIPSAGLPEFEAWASSIPSLQIRRELPDDWKSPETAVIYGGADTLSFFRDWLAPGTRIIEHGPKLSAAFVFENIPDLASRLASDIMRYNQRGCLSVQAVYCSGDIESFAQDLSAALAAHPTEPATLSEAGTVRNERETLRFRIANGSPDTLIESENSTDWTLHIDRTDPTLRPGPGSGFVRLIPMPPEISPETLGPESAFLSTAVVEPISEADRLEKISPPRICAADQAQEPGIFWHPDGEMPLAGLVRWRDLG
ncbi:MAG: acyl-CoA reductase [Luteolibacter sp.]